MPENSFHELKQMLNVKAVESFDKYLSLPTIIGKSKAQIFSFVKERVWKKLKGWKEKFLFEGREGGSDQIRGPGNPILRDVLLYSAG